jgi:two-component system, cell cycle sensor histidine kinase and response regulator CckA
MVTHDSTSPPMPSNEAARMESLKSYAVLDTPAEAAFDDLVHLAAQICGAPMAAVSLVDSDRQWFKARLGIQVCQTNRSNSFCAYGIAQERELFMVPDARLDSRFAQLPLVQEDPHIQFYTGAKLSDSDGHSLGMLCVMDRVPRQLDERQQEAMQILARQVAALLELHRELALHQASRELLERSQRKLLESEALYHSLVDNLPLFLLRKDTAGRITFANKSFCDAWRCSASELLGKTDFDLLPEEIASRFRATDQRVLATGEAVEVVEEITRADGRALHVQTVTSPLSDRRGNTVGVQVFSKDVSEAHRLEMELMRAQDLLETRVGERTAELEAANELLKTTERQANDWKNRYDLIAAASGLAVYDIDRLTGEVFWGSGADNVLGLEPTTLNRAGNEWLELVHPQDREAVMRGMEDAIVNGLSFNIQYRLRRGPDHYRWIQDRGVLVPDAQGRCVRVLGLMEDVTRRKLAEETMREQAALLNQTQDAILVLDLENHVLYWNHTAERLYGWTEGEALGRPIQDLLLRGEISHLPSAHAAAVAKGEWSGEIQVFTKPDKELTVHSRWSLLRDDDGNPNAFLIAHTDVTERKTLEAKFLRAQRLESIGALASGIAHDLNNVFTPILMSAELLAGQLNETTRTNTLAILNSSARRGSEMVKQVLSFARGHDNGPGLVQLKHLLSELEKMMRDTFPPNIRIERNVAPDLLTVRGDATQLYRS